MIEVRRRKTNEWTSNLRKYLSMIIRQFTDSAFPRFLCVGFTNFLVGYLLFNMTMLWLPCIAFRTAICQLISYSSGILWSFFWNRILTFKSKGSVTRQAVKFVILQVFLAVISAGAISAGIDLFHFQIQFTWIVVMSVITVINFVLSKFWAFAIK